jgi:hypothetical protein
MAAQFLSWEYFFRIFCIVFLQCGVGISSGTPSCIAHGGSVQQPDAIAGFISQSMMKNIKILSYMHRNIATVDHKDKKYRTAESYTCTVFGFCEELTTLFYKIFAKVWVCAGIL